MRKEIENADTSNRSLGNILASQSFHLHIAGQQNESLINMRQQGIGCCKYLHHYFEMQVAFSLLK